MTERSRVQLGMISLAAAFLVLGLFGSSSTAVDRPKCDGVPATMVGGPGDNTITGTEHRDVIVGGRGEDTIDGRGGGDDICGGGENTIGADGSDDIKGGGGGDLIQGEAGSDVLFQNASGSFGELDGGPDRDQLLGGNGDEKLRGGGARDVIEGDAGNDVLKGEAGNDALDGGADTDNCKQGLGSGTIAHCEADLSVHVSGPDTASPGPITFTVRVKNHGPSHGRRLQALHRKRQHQPAVRCGLYGGRSTSVRACRGSFEVPDIPGHVPAGGLATTRGFPRRQGQGSLER